MKASGLFSAANASVFELSWRELKDLPSVGKRDVRVEVFATSINPIDVKRAGGYGASALRMKGAAGMPRVLGNDLVGVVLEVGSAVNEFTVGQRVWGVMDTGPIGAHASHAVVPAGQLQPAPERLSNDLLSVLPYTFCTMWRSLRETGLHSGNAKGRRVLIHGASGGLGLLALQVLREWGAHTTAVCSTTMMEQCLSHGATEAFDRTRKGLQELPAFYDAVLNFATWSDERMLAEKLGPRALGMACTTHPLLCTLDQFGWLRGIPRILKERKAMCQLVRAHSPGAAYSWTVFRPDAEALHTLGVLVESEKALLPIGISRPIEQALDAFTHVAKQERGRAVLTLPR